MDPLNVSGLQQPSMNLGGLLGMSSLSGNPTNMAGTQAGQGGAGMSPGMDLAQLLASMGSGDEQSAVGAGQPLGTSPVSIAQQQAMGQAGIGQQGYLTAGGTGGGGGMLQFGNTSADPLAIIQKVLGLAQKGVSATGTSNQSLLPSNDTASQTPDLSAYQAGATQDYTGLESMLQSLTGGGQQPTGNLGSDFPMTFEEFRSLDQPSDYSTLLPDSAIQGPGGIPRSATQMLEGTAGDEGFSLGFNPTFGNSLGVLGGLAGLAGGIQSGNPYGITGGALGTAGNAASMLGYPGVGGVIGGLGGPLSLAAGAQSGNPLSLASGALQTYQLASQLAAYFPEMSAYLPSLGQLASQALQAVAPTVAETLGLGASAGATAGTAGASASGALALPALAAAIGYGIFSKNEADQMAHIISGMKETARDRAALPGAVSDLTASMQGVAGLPADLSTLGTPDILNQLAQFQQTHDGAMEDIFKVINTKGSSAPSRIPRIDTGGLENLTAAEYNTVPLGIAALQDELARRGVPMDQYWSPLSGNDILGLVGNAPVSPEQLASIGPGNMLPSLQALRMGQPLTNLPQALPGVGQARLSAAQGLGEDALLREPHPTNYFLNSQQQQQLQERYQMYPSDLAQSMAYSGSESQSNYGPVPQSPFQLWQQMLGMYQVPGTPQGMYGQAPPAPQQPQPGPQQPLQAPPTGMPVPQTPQQAMTLQALLSRQPGFGAQGYTEDPYLPLLFAQYGLA